ncbi:flagellar protein FlaG [Phenylobacterium sp.]|uniref:flagellar protein FlaG n=1 Tax=Phenylobacterium sp. TaxID=1871053 RepID=UPI00301D4644
MDSKVAAVAAVPDPGSVQVTPTAKDLQRAQAPAVVKEAASKDLGARDPDQVSMRLVIEMDKASGAYVYKTINRLTGEVLSQLPRAEVLKLKDERQYAAGTLIRTKV